LTEISGEEKRHDAQYRQARFRTNAQGKVRFPEKRELLHTYFIIGIQSLTTERFNTSNRL